VFDTLRRIDPLLEIQVALHTLPDASSPWASPTPEHTMTTQADAEAPTVPFDAAAFFAQSRDFCVVYDTTRRFVYLNRTAAGLLGRDADALVGKSLRDVFGDRAASMDGAVVQAIEGGDATHVVHKIRPSPGVVVYLDTSYTPVRDAKGDVAFVTAIGRDVTDTSPRWRELEDTVARRTRDLSEMESRFDVLVRNLQIGVLIRGPQAELRFCNRRALELLGVTEDQLRDRAPLDPGWGVVGEDNQPLPADMWPTARAIATGKAVQSMLMGVDRPKQGDRVWVICNVVLQRDSRGELEQIIVTFSDVTSTRKATEALADREATFRLLAETITDVFWMMDSSGERLIYVSPAYETVWGRSLEALYADRFDFVRAIHEDDRERVRLEIADQGEGTYDVEYRVIRPDGTMRWVRDRAFPVKDAEGKLLRIVGLATDVTPQRQASDLIRSQAEALRVLSTPLVPIGDGVLAMPIVGVLDSARARQVLETLLEGIVSHAAEVVILDVTGVGVVDAQVASALVSATQAARLLGAEVAMTGLRPDVAQAIVDLGIDFSGLVTRSTLQMGIRYALEERKGRKKPAARRRS
jgi:PAS domain S-box-containing protein